MGRTVEEVIESISSSKFWLCPSTVFKPRFNPSPIMGGLECTKTTVPEVLKSRRVKKSYSENGRYCIIWINDEDFENSIDQGGSNN